MSSKTIALESSVYERLARRKRPSESFTKTIARILDNCGEGTCADAVTDSARFWQGVPAESEADRLDAGLRQARLETSWEVERPESSVWTPRF